MANSIGSVIGEYTEHEHIQISILIPVYNEASMLLPLITRLDAVAWPAPVEFIWVDDGSTDASWNTLAEFSRRLNFIRLRHRWNMGKSAAIRRALGCARGSIVVTQDADLEYDPMELPRLLQPMLRGEADAVYGSRFLGNGNKMRWDFYCANRGLTKLTNLMLGSHLTDMETGYKILNAEWLRRVGIESQGFALEVEITAKLLRAGARIVEIPVSFHARNRKDGKKIRWRDGPLAVMSLWQYARTLKMDHGGKK
jgi:glycosyltransferase involved in cell wall biosynthesis